MFIKSFGSLILAKPCHFSEKTVCYICLCEIVPILTSRIEGNCLPSLPYEQRNNELHLSMTSSDVLLEI